MNHEKSDFTFFILCFLFPVLVIMKMYAKREKY